MEGNKGNEEKEEDDSDGKKEGSKIKNGKDKDMETAGRWRSKKKLTETSFQHLQKEKSVEQTDYKGTDKNKYERFTSNFPSPSLFVFAFSVAAWL